MNLDHPADVDVDKAIGQFRLALNGVFVPFHYYGMDVAVPGAKEQVLELALKLHQRLVGNDNPIQLEVYNADD